MVEISIAQGQTFSEMLEVRGIPIGELTASATLVGPGRFEYQLAVAITEPESEADPVLATISAPAEDTAQWPVNTVLKTDIKFVIDGDKIGYSEPIKIRVNEVSTL